MLSINQLSSPKIVFVMEDTEDEEDFGYMIAIRGTTYAHGWVTMSRYNIIPQQITWGNFYISWYYGNANDGRYQLNESGQTYYWCALA